MTLFEELRAATLAAQHEQELPDVLAWQIFALLEEPQAFRGREAEIRELVEQVRLYDTYGQTGYMGMGVNNAILQGTLNRLRRAQTG